jgi:hypothetical protein
LTSNHHAATVAAPSQSATAHHAYHAPRGHADAAQPGSVQPVSLLSAAGWHATGSVCLAVLAGSVLLLTVALVLRWLRTGHAAPNTAAVPVAESRLAGRSPPGAALLLPKLCVLRI